jgi:hypothetical protein
VKDLDIGELWANYAMSYVHANLGELNKAEFTLWANNYLQKESTKGDIEPDLAIGSQLTLGNEVKRFF